MTTLLIADLHLHPGATEITDGFFDYIERRASKADALYILGDLFDAWIGDDILDAPGMHPLAEDVINRLAALSRLGTAVYLMHGNRDFLLGQRFANDCQAMLLDEPTILEHDGERYLLMHGDSLCTRDEAYMTFRAQTRDPEWQAYILSLPIEQRFELAKTLRTQSGEATSTKAEDIMDVTPDEVEKALLDQRAHHMIHGHTHRPDTHELKLQGQTAIRYVLGDWQPTRGWDILIEDGARPQLRDFPLK
ncbi:UDP-2,3-diacylglucosamine diphosphatase [Aidingimonas lacisalsi]|uniref:UDP-2,3-diacylglucosamine diphosphatase n=1 Tax=Aidingimonas lacisalsi TaxID=2604086 RepID=UPI0011D24C63|nr:UDP-2,3-diacylglucosamine diphosphatase [Aidingimonas lacisalsi]